MLNPRNPLQQKILSVLSKKLSPLRLQTTPVVIGCGYMFDYSPTSRLYLVGTNNTYDVTDEPISYFNSVISRGFFPPANIHRKIITDTHCLYLKKEHPTYHFSYLSSYYPHGGYNVSILHADKIPTGDYWYKDDVLTSLFSSSGEVVTIPIVQASGVVFQKVIL